MRCERSRLTGSGGLTGAGRGCSSTLVDWWVTSLRRRAYGIHMMETRESAGLEEVPGEMANLQL
jgi:hypothetical protein